MKGWIKSPLLNSLMVRLTAWYIFNLFLIIIIIGSIILFTVSYFLINNTKQDTFILQNQLLQASKEQEIDWQEAIDNLLYPNYGNFYVHIIDSDGNTIASSHGWDQISVGNFTDLKSSLIHNLLLDKRKAMYYTSSTTWTQPNGKKGKIIVISQLQRIWNFLGLLTKVLIPSTFIGGILGSILIYLVTKKTMKPLKMITNTVSKMKEHMDFRLRVPLLKGPQEFTILANSFNTLLIKIENQFDKERSFVSNASHELRTPITAFRGHINLLKRWGKKDPEILDQSIKALEIEGERMQRLIDQLLTLARTDSPYTERSLIDLGSIVQEAEKELILSLKPQLDLVTHIQTNVKILGDPDQIRQLAVILIENAIKYTNEKGKIDISVFPQNNCGIVKIKDTGIGIDEKDLNKIFERFYRIDKARSRKTGGSGLGLSIAREIVEAHKGTIDIESKLGEGSTFTVKFPFR